MFLCLKTANIENCYGTGTILGTEVTYKNSLLPTPILIILKEAVINSE